jgi:hypothetical protein
MSWYRKFKNQKNKTPYEISGAKIEEIISEYLPEEELHYSCRWRDYSLENTTFSILRRTPYEFALEEIHMLYSIVSTTPGYHVEIDYIRKELSWFRDLIGKNKLIYTAEWILDEERSIYFFKKYTTFYKKYFFENWSDGAIFSGFPLDPNFDEVYYTSEDVSNVVSGSEKRSKIWARYFGMSKHRIFGHQFAKLINHKLEPLEHPCFRKQLKNVAPIKIEP